jgi:hypothetical protein
MENNFFVMLFNFTSYPQSLVILSFSRIKLLNVWLKLLYVTQDDDAVNKRKSDLKQQADEAFEKQDYTNASVLYTKVHCCVGLNFTKLICWIRKVLASIIISKDIAWHVKSGLQIHEEKNLG